MNLAKAYSRFLHLHLSLGGYSAHTVRAYSIDLQALVEHLGPTLELRSITSTDLHNYCATLTQRGYAPNTIRRKIAALKSFFIFLQTRGNLDHSPMAGLKFRLRRQRALPQALSFEEVRRLLSAAQHRLKNGLTCHKYFLALRNIVLLDLLLATGLRVSEACSLKTIDINLDSRLIRVIGKGKKDRIAFISHDDFLAFYIEYLDLRTSTEGPTSEFFLNYKGHPLSRDGVASIIKDISIAAGLTQRITPHTLRHTAAVLLLEHNVDIRVIRDFLGHASISTTQIYTELLPLRALAAIRVRPIWNLQ